MIYVGIDVAKDKHDCIIKNSEVISLNFQMLENVAVSHVAKKLTRVLYKLETQHLAYNAT